MGTKTGRTWAWCVGWGGWLLGLALAGCGPTLEQDRLRDIAEDGVVLFHRGQYQDARESFEFALKAKPTDANLLFNTGQCYDRLGDRAKAETYYQQCLIQDAKHAQCRQALAQLMMNTNRQQQAEEFIEEWLKSEPKLASAFALDGWRLRRDGQFDHAQRRLQQAVDLDRHCVFALTELGLLFEQLEHPERAIVMYERALQVTPHDEELIERVNQLRRKGAGKPLPE